MEVHPPHHPLHSWKDFWIHLGTITAGLLIALGMEQGVEALHRVHQRHELERDLHTEAVRNEQILGNDIRVLQADSTYLLGERRNVDALRHGVSPASLPQLAKPNDEDPFLPSAGAWSSARDSGQLALLPREQTSVFEELYAQREFLQQAVLEWFKVSDELRTFTLKAQENISGENTDIAKLTPAQRDEFSDLLSKLIVKIDSLMGNMDFYKKENDAVIRGVATVDELPQHVLAPASEAPQPSTIKTE
jgi:hypothetical protein